MAGWMKGIMMLLHMCCWYQSSVEIVREEIMNNQIKIINYFDQF